MRCLGDAGGLLEAGASCEPSYKMSRCYPPAGGPYYMKVAGGVAAML